MLWALGKIAAFFALVLGASVAAGRLSEDGGAIRIWAFQHEFTLGPIASVVALAAVILAVWIGVKLVGLVFALLRFITGDRAAFSRVFGRNRQKRGLRALSEGYLALASGEPTTALARARTAGRLLDQPELTALLEAQAAEAAGDSRGASEAWKMLLGDERTRFAAVRGLMQQKIAKGDHATAQKLAEQALALKPKHAETQTALLKLQAEGGDWKGARETLNLQHRAGRLPRALYKRRDALLALQEAKVITDEASSLEAREAAIEANRLSPDLIPAAIIAAKALAEQGDKKGAARILKKAWGQQPHPDLAIAFADLEPDEAPAVRLKRFKPLLTQNPQDPETRMTLAELHLAAEGYAEVKAVLGDLNETAPTQRSLTILAAAERGLGRPEAELRDLLARALLAPRGAEWCCENCAKVHRDWMPICDQCDGFDTLVWRVPERAVSAPSGTEPSQWSPLLFAQPSPRPESTPPVLIEAEEIDPPAQTMARQSRPVPEIQVFDGQPPATPDEILRRAT